jgi:hypothetical protein
VRFYSFTNRYTSGIHAGIQTAHAVHEMMTKYGAREDDRAAAVRGWAEKHKTIIVKQAGYHASLNLLYDEFKEPAARLALPLVRWCESKEALNGATTAIGIIIPPSVYSLRLERDAIPSSPDRALAAIINRYPMAV